MKPSLLIVASTESLYLAYEVESALEPRFDIRIWGKSIFNPNDNFMESLIDNLEAYDYGLIMLSQIDTEKIQKKEDDRENHLRYRFILLLTVFAGEFHKGQKFIMLPEGNKTDLPIEVLGIEALSLQGKENNLTFLSSICEDITEKIYSVRSSGGRPRMGQSSFQSCLLE